jgi:hypothetical protein
LRSLLTLRTSFTLKARSAILAGSAGISLLALEAAEEISQGALVAITEPELVGTLAVQTRSAVFAVEARGTVFARSTRIALLALLTLQTGGTIRARGALLTLRALRPYQCGKPGHHIPIEAILHGHIIGG